MSILKFRAWDAAQNYMAYQGAPDLETLSSFMFHYGNSTLMQATGFTDGNGNDIFEGDILSDYTDVDGEMTQSFMQVFWCSETGAWKLDNSYLNNMSCGEMLGEELANFTYEVTGNIFENPDLLK